MQRKTKWISGGAIAAAVLAGGTGIGLASGAGDDDKPLTGSNPDKAVDGSQVEVNLDADFNVIGQEADDDGVNDDDGSGDD